MELKSLIDVEHDRAVGYAHLDNIRLPFGYVSEMNLRMIEFLNDHLMNGHDLEEHLGFHITLLPNHDEVPIELMPFNRSFDVGNFGRFKVETVLRPLDINGDAILFYTFVPKNSGSYIGVIN